MTHFNGIVWIGPQKGSRSVVALLSVGSKMHNGRRDAVCLPSNLKSIRVCKDRERDVALIEIEGE